MKILCNVGGADKTFRIGLGALLVALVLFIDLSTALTVLVLVVAAVAFVTAFVGFCPLNRLLGVNTCRTRTA